VVPNPDDFNENKCALLISTTYTNQDNENYYTIGAYQSHSVCVQYFLLAQNPKEGRDRGQDRGRDRLRAPTLVRRRALNQYLENKLAFVTSTTRMNGRF